MLLFLILGCAHPVRKVVPEKLVKTVKPLHLNSIRSFIEPGTSLHLDFFSNSLTPVFERYKNSITPLTMLALSGGGDGGAYGAGFLNGWTIAGNRPEFDIVTGISTGALMAPFAFLGSETDGNLKAVYTGISAENIYDVRSVQEMFTRRDAIADSKPLAQLLKKYVDDKVIAGIGWQHKHGRRLFVGTTHLDSGRLVVWDMGAIALSKHPDAPQLFRDILLSSASIPIAFPPVYISIEYNGRKFDEMHVDGGLINQVFGIEIIAHLLHQKNKDSKSMKARLYMIRNSKITTPWHPVERKLIDIATKTVDVMINSQSIGDIYRNYFIAKETGVDFYLTGIPENFEAVSSGAFDTGYMNTLFKAGYQKGSSVTQWERTPPGLRDFIQ